MRAEFIEGVMVFHMSKEEMLEAHKFPYYGWSMIPRIEPSYIHILEDLPPRVYTSVLAHERQHISDRAFLDGRVWHWEARAWWAGFQADWRGFLQGIWMSATSAERLYLYWKRITGGF